MPETNKSLPLEWRGAYVMVDAVNRFDTQFVKMDFGASICAALGYKQYNFRFEAVAPLSAQGWSYRLRFGYQIF